VSGDHGDHRTVPVLDIGGTHCTAALVDAASWQVVGEHHRVDVDSRAGTEQILDAFAAAAADLAAPAGARWAVAMPDPFDYPGGIGRFHGVGKYEALDGVDVRGGLLARLPGSPADIVFANDADAFTVGEWVAGAAAGTRRAVGLTLGTGVGSGWVDSGHVVDPGSPAGGRAHRLFVDGVPLEDAMSRRAIRRAYAAATGDTDADVREISERARAGDGSAAGVLAHSLHALGRALAPVVHAFGADVVVVGGSMSGSWELFEPWFREGAGPVPVPPTPVAADPDGAPLIGAAHIAVAG
jgi:glucokinase